MALSPEQALQARFNNKVRKSRGSDGLMSYRVCCPFCAKPDKKYKLYVTPEKDAYHCFRCGSSGNIRRLLGNVRKAQEGPQKMPTAPVVQDVVPPGEMDELSYLSSEHPAILYLTKERARPFDPDQISRAYDVKYCKSKNPALSRYYFDTTGTLIFPIYMWEKLVGWQSRLLYDPEALEDFQCEAMQYIKEEDGEWRRPPKYFISPGCDAGRTLYNFDIARMYDPVVITEGVFDAMAVGPAAMATFGKGISEVQMRMIKTYCLNRVVIMLDPGDASEESKELVNELRRSLNVTELQLEKYKDPGDAPTDEIWKQISAKMQEERLLAGALMATTAQVN